MRDAPFWITICLIWLSGLLFAWPVYAKAAWRKWRDQGGGVSRLVVDTRRFFDMMLMGKYSAHLYEPGQNLRLGITFTMGSSLIMAVLFGLVDRSKWSNMHLVGGIIIIGLSYVGVMIHLYIAWRDIRWKWRILLLSQIICAPLVYGLLIWMHF